MFRSRWKTFLGLGLLNGLAITAVTAVCAIILALAIIGEVMRLPYPGPDDVARIFSSVALWFGVGMGLAMVIVYLTAWWFGLAMVRIADGELTGAHASMGEALRVAGRGVPSLSVFAVGGALVVGLLVGGMLAWFSSLFDSISTGGLGPSSRVLEQFLTVWLLLLLGGVIVSVASVLLSIKLFVMFPVMVAEDVPVWRALGRSWNLTKGAGGMIFLLQLLLGFIIGTISQVSILPTYLVTLPSMTLRPGDSPTADFTWLAPMFIGSGLSSLLTIAISALTMCVMPVVTSVVYRDRLQKVRF